MLFPKGLRVIRKSDGRSGVIVIPDAPGWDPIVRFDDAKDAWSDKFVPVADLEIDKDQTPVKRKKGW